MSQNIQIPFAALLTNYFQQPQRVEHVTHPVPVQSTASGSPYDMGDYEVIMMDGDDSSGGELPVDDSELVFGDPTSEMDYYQPPRGEAYGGIFDGITQAMRGSVRSTRSAGSRAVNAVKSLTMQNRKQINKNRAAIARNRRNVVNALKAATKQVKESEKNKWMAAALAAAQALPGVKSYNVLTGAAHQATISGLAAFHETFSKVWDDDVVALSLPVVDDVTAADVAAINALKALLVERQDLIATRINSIESSLSSCTDAAEREKFAENIALFGKQSVSDSLTDIAALLPSQFEQKDAALLEGGIKYMLGKEGDGSNGFNFSIG